ncbi:MAG: hypothetical protein Tsb0021_09520 [Chlamydiales bacterium]
MKIYSKEYIENPSEHALNACFLGRSPLTSESTSDILRNIADREYQREELVRILVNYNVSIGNDARAQTQALSLLKKDAFCVVTGHQLGFMGGPALLIYKALSTLKLAEEKGLVPVFWLATEDHDISEIDHANVIDEKGNLKSYKLHFPYKKFVEDLKLDSEHLKTLNAFINELSVPIEIDVANRDSYAFTMAKYLAALFKGTGLVFIEPRFLREMSRPIFQKEVLHREEIKQVLKQTTDALTAEGGEAVLSFPHATNLFYKDADGNRVPLEIREEKELIDHIESHPEKFSANAALRTIVQSYCLPTAVYFAGPTELAYYRQLKDYHFFHGLSMPWVLPRMHATVVNHQAAAYLEQHHLDPWDFDKIFQLEGFEGHYLRNFLYPKKKPQERVLNVWSLFPSCDSVIIQTLLHHLKKHEQGHLYIWNT